MSNIDEKTGISTAADVHEPSHVSLTQAHANAHAAPEVLDSSDLQEPDPEPPQTVEEIQESKKGRFAYFKTKDFYIVLLLGYLYLTHQLYRNEALTSSQPSPRPLHHLDKHLLLPPRRARHLDPRLPNLV